MNPEKAAVLLIAALAAALLGWALMHPGVFFVFAGLLLVRGVLALVWR